MQLERIPINFDRIEFYHQIFWVAIRINFSEGFNPKSGKIDTNPGLDLKKIGWIVNRNSSIFRFLVRRKLNRSRLGRGGAGRITCLRRPALQQSSFLS
jgi:hypothetical protein